MNGKTMKKPQGSSRRRNAEGELAREYRFDYGKSRPNRFARQVGKDAVAVVLDPDVAEVFGDPVRVNALLRAAITAVEKDRPRRRS